jgi:hypothetical protein
MLSLYSCFAAESILTLRPLLKLMWLTPIGILVIAIYPYRLRLTDILRLHNKYALFPLTHIYTYIKTTPVLYLDTYITYLYIPTYLSKTNVTIL